MFVINQNYYSGKRAIAAFVSSFLIGIIGGEIFSVFLVDYLNHGKSLSIEVSSFLIGAFIIPVYRMIHHRLSIK